MNLPEILSALSALDEQQLRKVKGWAEQLLGDDMDDGSATSWPVFVWQEVGRQLQTRGLPRKSANLVLSGPKRDQYVASANSLRGFLARAMLTEDDLKLRLGLPLLIDTGLGKMEQRGMALVAPLVCTVMPDFPAYLSQAYPGIRSPKHFRTIWKLYRRSRERR